MKGCTARVESLHFRNINSDAYVRGLPEDTIRLRYLLANFEHFSKSARASLPLYSAETNYRCSGFLPRIVRPKQHRKQFS
jgi:hypothetical protein